MIAKLKSPTVHAIRILKYIADHQEETLISEEISQDLDMASSYFMRIVKELRRAGIMESTQGRYGGFSLSRNPEDITLYDVVRAMEEEENLKQAPGMDQISSLLDQINSEIMKRLKRTSLKTL